jgi:hypothetical protein
MNIFMVEALSFVIVTGWVKYSTLRRRVEVVALSDNAWLVGAAWDHGYRPLRALLIMAVSGLSCVFCLNATAAPDRCPIDRGRLTKYPADPGHGFWWPYLLVTPPPIAASAHAAGRRHLGCRA